MTGPWWRSRAADERGPGGRRDRGGWERDARGRAVAAHVRLGGTGPRLTERVRAIRRTAWLVGMTAGAGGGWRGRLDLSGRGTGCRPRPIRGRVARACRLRGLRVGRGGSVRAGDQVAGAKPLRRQNRQAEQQRQEPIRHLRPRIMLQAYHNPVFGQTESMFPPAESSNTTAARVSRGLMERSPSGRRVISPGLLELVGRAGGYRSGCRRRGRHRTRPPGVHRRRWQAVPAGLRSERPRPGLVAGRG